MADFDLFLSKLLRLEAALPISFGNLPLLSLFEEAKKGGWDIDARKKDSAKMLGVSIGIFRSYFGKQSTLANLKELSLTQWKTVIKWYWDKCKADQIQNQSIAEIFVDWFFVSGVLAIRKAQVMFGVSTDGIVGPQMLKYLNSPNEEVIFNRLRSARESFYRKAVLTDPQKGKLLASWLKRTNSFKYEAGVIE